MASRSLSDVDFGMAEVKVITATPLESMPWASAIGRVKFNWREGTETPDQLRFLDDLIRSAEDERSRNQ